MRKWIALGVLLLALAACGGGSSTDWEEGAARLQRLIDADYVKSFGALDPADYQDIYGNSYDCDPHDPTWWAVLTLALADKSLTGEKDAFEQQITNFVAFCPDRTAAEIAEGFGVTELRAERMKSAAG